MFFGLFGKKKSSEAYNRMVEETKRMQAQTANEEKKYDDICRKVSEILSTSNKPSECNVVEFTDAPYIFPFLKSYQYYTQWEIWRNSDKIYIYCSEVENYPTNYDAPCIGIINVEDIQYFKSEGNFYTESKINGGTIKQDKRTGKISQTPIKSKTLTHDTRIVKLVINQNGVIKNLSFKKDAYDILFSLIPEKDYEKR